MDCKLFILAALSAFAHGCVFDFPDDVGSGDGDSNETSTTTESGDGDGDGDGSTGDGDGDETSGDGDPGDGDGDPSGDGDGDGDGDGECPPLDCDDTGRCWTWRPPWTADAQAITQAEIDEAIEAGTLEPVPDEPGCWTYAPDASTCVLELPPCHLLIGRPLDELEFDRASCDFIATGDWDSTASDQFGCWAVFESKGLAVRLREHD